MPSNRLSIRHLWDEISHIGVEDQDYSEARRIILSNQIAVFGIVVPQFYNIFYIYYDIKMLLPAILINIAGPSICFIVLLLNHFHKYTLAKMIICIAPNVQIFLPNHFRTTQGNSIKGIGPMEIYFLTGKIQGMGKGEW